MNTQKTTHPRSVLLVSLGLASCGPFDFGLTQGATVVSNPATSTEEASATIETSANTSSSSETSTASETSPSTSTEATNTTDNATSGSTTDNDTDNGGTEKPSENCQHIDVLFVLDGSPTMHERRVKLNQGLPEILQSLSDIKGGAVDYRIWITDDHGGEFDTPECWQERDPWVDSSTHSPEEMVLASSCSISTFSSDLREAPNNCQHALTQAVDLLEEDMTGFLQDDALLVVVIITDVDDYAHYNLEGGNACTKGCMAEPMDVGFLRDRLVAIKGGDATRVSSVVIAGGSVFSEDGCLRPGCNCGNSLCKAWHAPRLGAFTSLLDDRGEFINLCNFASSELPAALSAAFETTVNSACEAL